MMGMMRAQSQLRRLWMVNTSVNANARRLVRAAAAETTTTATTATATREVERVQDVSGPQTSVATAVAAAAAVEVSRAVRMRGVEAPDVSAGVAIRDLDDDDAANEERRRAVDEAGLPLVYSKERIQEYWDAQGGALQARWVEFLAKAVPFLTKLATLGLRGGAALIAENDAELARDARIICQDLGPTYIKLGQVLSVRPDVLPPAAVAELAKLQDSVEPFPTSTAIRTIESELGAELGAVFSSISEEPVAAASLAQVYRAVRADTGAVVAVKVQRPQCLELVSKDLYVLARAASVYQGLMDRFAPQQRTDYVALLNQWAVGFYTELDFSNEASNQQRIKDLLRDQDVAGLYIPEVHHDLCTRRLLVTEWIDGVKLSECAPEEISSLIGIGEEAFLSQLLQVGLIHGDPHPGNLLKMNDTSGDKLALLDFGLVASVTQREMDTMVSSIIHLANRDFAALVDDFIQLNILPADCNRAVVVPLMDKALSPYIKGGGAKKYEAEIRRTYGMDGTYSGAVGGFQAMTQDMLTVLNRVPFSIPPSFALLGRAVVTLEGIALMGNPDYALVMSAYPFIARKVLRDDRPDAELALMGILYGGGGTSLRGRRLSSILNSAMGVISEKSAFVDLDAVPEESVSLRESVAFILSPKAQSLRRILEKEVQRVFELFVRSRLRQAMRASFAATLPQAPGFLKRFAPSPDDVRVPFLVPRLPRPESLASSNPEASSSLPPSSSGANPLDELLGATPVPVFATAPAILEAVAPALSREEEVYLLSMSDAVSEVAGADVNKLFSPASFVAAFSRAMGIRLPGANDADADTAGARIFDERVGEVSAVVGGLTDGEREQLRQSAAKIVNSTVAEFVTRAQALLAR